MIRYILFSLGGFILGLIVSQQFCNTIPTEKIVTKEVTKTVTDTLYYPYIIEVENKATPVKQVQTTENKTKQDSIIYITKTVYKDKEIIVKDYYPVLDTNCMKQLDSVKRSIILKGVDSTIINDSLTTIETTVYKQEPNYKRIYIGTGLMYDNVSKDFNFKYTLDYQFKNKVIIGAEGLVPFKNTKYVPVKYAVNLKIPFLKFK